MLASDQVWWRVACVSAKNSYWMAAGRAEKP